MASRAASRYAKSILSLAVEQGNLEEVHKDMLFIANICKENHDLQLLLKSPVVKTDKKQAILKAIFGANTGKLVSTFVEIITNKKRESIIEDIAQSFGQQYNAHKNITSAKISTAIKMDKAMKDKIMAIVKKSTDGEVELEEVVNKDLIGGFIIKIGDQQVDTSIQSKLHKLHREFSENPYVNEL